VSAHISHAPTPIHNRHQDVVGVPFRKVAHHRSRRSLASLGYGTGVTPRMLIKSAVGMW
jgi:hypothetical protein